MVCGHRSCTKTLCHMLLERFVHSRSTSTRYKYKYIIAVIQLLLYYIFVVADCTSGIHTMHIIQRSPGV